MKKVTKAIFPVAGLGTRFLPATKAQPKEMLTVVDKPIIQYAVEEALAAGITDLVFVTGRGKSAIENHFDKPYELASLLEKKGKTKELETVLSILPKECRIWYTRQGEPLGLGHAVGCARTLIDDEPFAVLLPDDIITSPQNTLKEMIAVHEKTQGSVVLCMDVPPERTQNYGVLDVAGNTVHNQQVQCRGFVEKPKPEQAPSTLAVMGRYIFTPTIFDEIENLNVGAGGEYQLTDAMHKLAQKQPFHGFVLQGERFDCGDKVGFQMANLHFAMKDEFIAPRLLPFMQALAMQYDRRSEVRKKVV